jgi:hypothetical protein
MGPFGRPGYRWDDNIKMGYSINKHGESVDWIHLVQVMDL